MHIYIYIYISIYAHIYIYIFIHVYVSTFICREITVQRHRDKIEQCDANVDHCRSIHTHM